MHQPALFAPQSLTVADLTRYLRGLLEEDDLLQDVWVLGEVSNLSRPSSGHVYFTLKDESASLRCVIWRNPAARIASFLENGLAVEAHGRVSLYERDGQYQLYIDALRPAGEGWLYQEFLQLKARLEAGGLFDEERKRPIPERPRRIGIVTSPTGAALQDMLNTLAGRYPLAEVLLAACPVQGDEAPPAIVNALAALNRLHPDVILMARGGGSLEDLWAFNDERVVRAVAASQVPVVTGVGHETDFTLADFAADLRAPTPTAAAVLATPDVADLRLEALGLRANLVGSFAALLAARRERLEQARLALQRAAPMRRVQDGRQQLDGLLMRQARAIRHQLELRRSRHLGMEQRLLALNPLAVLQRGYALVQSDDGTLVRSARQVHVQQHLQVRVADGSFGVKVDEESK